MNMMKYFALILLAALTWSVNAQTTCVDPLACNFTELGECEFLDDNGMPCVTEGCAIPGACNFNPEADINDGSCEFTSCLGCTDEAACNYDPEAVYLDMSCIYFVDCNGVCGGDWIEDECGNCYEITTSSGFEEFFFSGSPQTFVVPSNVYSVVIECWGAEGGEASSSIPAGQGGYATGDLAVTPGQTLHIYVGGRGQINSSFQAVSSGGWNGGGDGIGGWSGNFSSGRGTTGGGGGASDVRVEGSSLSDRVIVAGGGGGSDSYSDSRFGGDGGGLSGSSSGGGASGGTQSTGGNYGQSGTNGVLGIGGDGFLSGSDGHGCGGGGGYYGGGGGQHSGAGGGGGSSYVGGVLNGQTTAGVREGDGFIVISWEEQTPPLCLLGCVVPQACNFNPEATNDDGSCDFCFCGPGTTYSVEAGQCLVVGGGSDINGDGCTNLGDLLDLLAGYGTCQE